MDVIMRKVQLKAYGKINITLDILGKRPDGYHELQTVFQGISLYDDVIIEKGENGISLTCDLPELSTGPENLAYKAATVIMKDFPDIQGVKIHLTKKIPLAAGLAGGSTDAAAVLVGINELYDLHLSYEQLITYGGRLGSDVPFCLFPLTAVGEGRGEILKECSPCPELWLVMAKPPFSVSTKDVYQNLSRVTINKRPEIEKVLQGLKEKNIDLIYQYMSNVLEFSTFQLHPQLKEWVKEIEDLGAEKVMMSGSGPSLLAFTLNKDNAEKLRSSLKLPGWNIEIVRTTNINDLKERMVFYE
jgi:4-diphosphocytidyl-2-C-methyl-D-erythritol kinase